MAKIIEDLACLGRVQGVDDWEVREQCHGDDERLLTFSSHSSSFNEIGCKFGQRQVEVKERSNLLMEDILDPNIGAEWFEREQEGASTFHPLDLGIDEPDDLRLI
jgi:hypothetical protein